MHKVYIFIPQQILKVHSWKDAMLGILGVKSKLVTKLTLESSMSNKKCTAGTVNRDKRLLDRRGRLHDFT